MRHCPACSIIPAEDGARCEARERRAMNIDKVAGLSCRVFVGRPLINQAVSPEDTMQLHIALPIQAFVQSGSTRWNGAVEFLQPVIIAFNVSGMAGSLLAVAGLLAVAASRGLMSVLDQGACAAPARP